MTPPKFNPPPLEQDQGIEYSAGHKFDAIYSFFFGSERCHCKAVFTKELASFSLLLDNGWFTLGRVISWPIENRMKFWYKCTLVVQLLLLHSLLFLGLTIHICIVVLDPLIQYNKTVAGEWNCISIQNLLTNNTHLWHHTMSCHSVIGGYFLEI